MRIKTILYFLRAHQWVKNLLIFAPLFFSGNFLKFDELFNVTIVFFLLSLIASSGYVFNDLIDAEKDRLHPFKKNRPLASGAIGRNSAIKIFISVSSAAILISYLLNFKLGILLSIYLACSILYSLFFKKVIFLDILCIIFFFLYRVYIGAEIIGVELSFYIIILASLLSFLIIFSKRMVDNSLSFVVMAERAPFVRYLPILLSFSVITAYIYYIRHLFLLGGGLLFLIASLLLVLTSVFRFIWIVFHNHKLNRNFDQIIFDRLICASCIIWAITLFVVFYG